MATKKQHKRYTENRTKNSLGKEKVGDKLGKNKPGRMTRTSTGMRGNMSRKRTTYKVR